MHDSHTDPHGHGAFATKFKYFRYFGDYWNSPVNGHILELVQLRPHERALDIGAGMGPAAIPAAGIVAQGQVVAIDPSSFMRRVLGIRRLWHRGRGRIRILDGTAEKIPVADGSIDAAWAVNSLHHWASPTIAMGEILRVLRPGGRMLLLDEDFDHPEHQSHTPGQTNPHTMPSEEELTELLNSSGFTKIAAKRSTVASNPVRLLQGTKPE